MLPLEEVLSDIFETLKNTALIYHSGGGQGFPFSGCGQRGCGARSGAARGKLSERNLFTEEVAAGIAARDGWAGRGGGHGRAPATA